MAPEVPHRSGADSTLVSLALEEDGKRHEGESVNPDSIDPAVTGASEHFDIPEPSFPKEPLGEPLERLRCHSPTRDMSCSFQSSSGETSPSSSSSSPASAARRFVS